MSDMEEEEPASAGCFSDEFKAEAVELVLDKGKSVNQVTQELDLIASALGDWGNQSRHSTRGAPVLS